MKKSKAHKITEEIQRIEIEIIEPLYKELEQYQSKCKHKRLIAEFHSNTGNWDSSFDSHWIDLYCPTCMKSWTVDNSNDEYQWYSINSIKVASIEKWKNENKEFKELNDR